MQDKKPRTFRDTLWNQFHYTTFGTFFQRKTERFDKKFSLLFAQFFTLRK